MIMPNRIRVPKRCGSVSRTVSRGCRLQRAAALLGVGCFLLVAVHSAVGQSVRDDVARLPNRDVVPTSGGETSEAVQPATSDSRIALHKQAFQYRRQGRFREAAEFFKRELAAVESDPESELAQRAAVTHNLGEAYLRLGNYDAASTLLTKAANLWKEGREDSSLAAATLFQLAHLRRLQARYNEAYETLQRATVLCGDACKSGHEAAVSMVLWGDLHLAQARLHDAEAAYAQAREHAAEGTDTTVEIDAWSGLAMVYRRQARYREAEYAARKAITLARQHLGGEHTSVAVGLANLGLIQAFRRKYSAARKSLRDALARVERSSGSNSPDVAPILNNLAFVDQQTGRLASAESLLRHALEINTKAYGSEHPSVAMGWTSLGVLALQRGEPRTAEDYLRKGLAITQKSFGVDHPETARVLVHLGLSLAASGRPEQAIPLYERALKIRRQALGDGHPEVAETLAQWAAALHEAGRGREAKQLKQRAREVRSAWARDNATGQTIDVETLLQESPDRM